MNRILKWELSGVLFVFLLGALFHFVFEWSGESPIVGAFASVNESVWEHFKQGYFPMIIFMIVESRYLPSNKYNLFAAKAVAVYVIPVITAVVFYIYSSIIGEEILIVDIIIFAIAILVGQLISYKILFSKPVSKRTNTIALAFIFALGLILITTTYFPPHLPIFEDATGFYGLP